LRLEASRDVTALEIFDDGRLRAPVRWRGDAAKQSTPAGRRTPPVARSRGMSDFACDIDFGTLEQAILQVLHWRVALLADHEHDLAHRAGIGRREARSGDSRPNGARDQCTWIDGNISECARCTRQSSGPSSVTLGRAVEPCSCSVHPVSRHGVDRPAELRSSARVEPAARDPPPARRRHLPSLAVTTPRPAN